MQQIYKRAPMTKRDFTSAWMFSCKFTAYFQNTFSYEHLLVAASEHWNVYCLQLYSSILNFSINITLKLAPFAFDSNYFLVSYFEK